MGGEVVSIPGRFNGPRSNANGGYTAGVIAGLTGRTTDVSLRAPVPLDRPLSAETGADGVIRLLDGGSLIAEGNPAEALDLEVPEPVAPDDARAASFGYLGRPDGLFADCFVCGRGRDDALAVFAGPVPGRPGVVASPWTPPGWTADEAGAVRPEIVSAVLDCPTFFALYPVADPPLSFLARMTFTIDAAVPAGVEHVVFAWPLERDGRKHHAGSALLSADGAVLARARVLLIEARA